MIAPGKKDHVYKGKRDGVKIFETKRFLLWTLRDLHDSLNGMHEQNDENSFMAKFNMKLPFTVFYEFIKANKEYHYNGEMPHFSCMCEVCENAVLLAKSMQRECKSEDIPTNPHSIGKIKVLLGY